MGHGAAHFSSALAKRVSGVTRCWSKHLGAITARNARPGLTLVAVPALGQAVQQTQQQQQQYAQPPSPEQGVQRPAFINSLAITNRGTQYSWTLQSARGQNTLPPLQWRFSQRRAI